MANRKRPGVRGAQKSAPAPQSAEKPEMRSREAQAPAEAPLPADEPAAPEIEPGTLEKAAPPEAAARPDISEVPETPEDSGTPEDPEIHEDAEAPEGPGAPEDPETSDASGTPEEPDAGRAASEIERELADCKDKYLRLAAEYDNYRKRTQRQRETLYADAAADTAEQFLPVYDNLERALGNKTEDTAYYKGVELIRDGLLDVLAKLRIRPIEALGRPFDPALHDAVMHTQDDSGEENIVAEVFQVGFIMDDRVIRHALVKVKN